MLITARLRATMSPAIWEAFERLKERSIPNAEGATTALKNTAAPSQSEHRINREALTNRIAAYSFSQTHQSPATNEFVVV
jgi:hypothetical protein